VVLAWFVKAQLIVDSEVVTCQFVFFKVFWVIIIIIIIMIIIISEINVTKCNIKSF